MRALQLLAERKIGLTEIDPPPPPSEGEVQLAPRVVGLNHLDLWVFRGMAFAKRVLPLTAGADALPPVRDAVHGVPPPVLAPDARAGEEQDEHGEADHGDPEVRIGLEAHGGCNRATRAALQAAR